MNQMHTLPRRFGIHVVVAFRHSTNIDQDDVLVYHTQQLIRTITLDGASFIIFNLCTI
jgi:hypothetical protein